MAKKSPKHEPETVAAQARGQAGSAHGAGNSGQDTDDMDDMYVELHAVSHGEGNSTSIRLADDIFASEDAMHEHLHHALSEQAFAIAAPIINIADTNPRIADETKALRKRLKADEAFRAGLLHGLRFSVTAAVQTIQRNIKALETVTPEKLGPYYRDALRTAYVDCVKASAVASASLCLAFRLLDPKNDSDTEKELGALMHLLSEGGHMAFEFFAPRILADNEAPAAPVN